MANGKMFVFLSWATRSNNEVVEVSLATGAQQIRTDARNLTPPVPPRWTSVLERSGDRSRLYVVTLCSGYYDAATDTWVACIDPNLSNVFGVTTNTTGTQVTATNSIFDASLRTSWTADPSALGQTVLGMSSDGAIRT